MSSTLAVAVAELHIRLDRLKRENDRPVPAPRPPVTTTLDHGPSCWMCRYDELQRLRRAQRGQP